MGTYRFVFQIGVIPDTPSNFGLFPGYFEYDAVRFEQMLLFKSLLYQELHPCGLSTHIWVHFPGLHLNVNLIFCCIVCSVMLTFVLFKDKEEFLTLFYTVVQFFKLSVC